MDNKEMKNNAAELNDDALDTVSGGNVWLPIQARCAKCGATKTLSLKEFESRRFNGVYYCTECIANRGE